MDQVTKTVHSCFKLSPLDIYLKVTHVDLMLNKLYTLFKIYLFSWMVEESERSQGTVIFAYPNGIGENYLDHR